MSFIYGINTCNQYLQNNRKSIISVYFDKGFNKKDLINVAKRNHIKIKWVNSGKLDELSSGGNHQGVVLEINDFKYFSLEEILKSCENKQRPVIVMLDGIEDPHNLGAILRSCDATSVDGVIIGKNRCCELNGTVAKVSTGAIDTVKVHQATNLVQTVKKLKDKGFWVVGADIDERAVEYTQIKYDMPIVLVIGSEGFGISPLLKKNCDYLAYLPMKGKVNSLNASVAAGIMLYKINEY